MLHELVAAGCDLRIYPTLTDAAGNVAHSARLVIAAALIKSVPHPKRQEDKEEMGAYLAGEGRKMVANAHVSSFPGATRRTDHKVISLSRC